MSHNGTSPSSASPDPFVTIAKCADILPPTERVSVYKLHSLARAGHFTVYKLPNIKSACVKVDEVRAALARLTKQGKIRRGYGSFGPNAVVKDLSKVAGQDFEVIQ